MSLLTSPDTKRKTHSLIGVGSCSKKSLNKIMILQKLLILHTEFLRGTNVHCTVPATVVVLVTKREKKAIRNTTDFTWVPPISIKL